MWNLSSISTSVRCHLSVISLLNVAAEQERSGTSVKFVTVLLDRAHSLLDTALRKRYVEVTVRHVFRGQFIHLCGLAVNRSHMDLDLSPRKGEGGQAGAFYA